ncbi:hypothetical protein L208DRAFT_1409871, partial [Tricholoma matsutake]
MPAKLLEKISNVQNVAVSKSTQSKDTSRLCEFQSFCKALNVHDDDIFLAREDLLIAWASSYAGHFAGKMKEHEKQGLVWQGGEQLPVSSFCGKRPPVTISMLPICLLSFFSQLCSGELLPPTRNIQKFNPLCHAMFLHIAESTAQNGACGLHLPWSKTQKARGDDVWIPCQEAPLNPIHAIHKHYIRNKLNINHPIATYRDSHDNIITLTRILQVTNKGYPHITGHCFCIGGTTFYLVLGVPPDMVKKFSCWHSQAFLEYWRCLDYLVPVCVGCLTVAGPVATSPELDWSGL